MKKFLLLLLFTLSSMQAFSSYTGNPLSPALLQSGLFSGQNYLINVATGYVYDNVWDKDLTPTENPDFSSLEKVGDFEMRSNFATLALIFFRRLEVYGYFGVSKENIDWTAKTPFTSPEIATKNHFSYALGAKAIMLQFSQTVFSLDFQYFTLPSSNMMVQKIVNIYMPFDVNSQYLQVQQWHFTLGVASKIGPLTPYAGATYTRFYLQLPSNSNFPTLKFKGKRNWGLFLGASLNISHLFFVTGEVHFFDEKSYALSATTSF